MRRLINFLAERVSTLMLSIYAVDRTRHEMVLRSTRNLYENRNFKKVYVTFFCEL